jgi:hypothetical protein
LKRSFEEMDTQDATIHEKDIENDEQGTPTGELVKLMERLRAYRLYCAQPRPTAVFLASSRDDSELPPLISTTPVPRNGCWILSPCRDDDAMELLYAVVQDEQIRIDQTPARSFGGRSQLIPCRSGSRAYVCELQQAVPQIWQVRFVSSLGGAPISSEVLYTLPFEPSQADLLANPRTDDMWALTKVDGANRQLFVTTFRDPFRPVKLLELTNADAQLVAAEDSGAWLHITGSGPGAAEDAGARQPIENSGRSASPASGMEPGLWHVSIDPVWSPDPPALLHFGEMSEGAHVAPTLGGIGVWTLSRRNETNRTTSPARCVLSLKTVEEGEDGAEKRVASTSTNMDMPFERVFAMVAAPGGVYLHCKAPVNGKTSKLVLACLDSTAVKAVVDCPRPWSLHSAHGGCWVWKKVGGRAGRAHEHALSFVAAKDCTTVRSERTFPAGSSIPIKPAPPRMPLPTNHRMETET